MENDKPAQQSEGSKRQLWVFITAAILLVLTIGYFARSIQTKDTAQTAKSEEVAQSQSAATQENPDVSQTPVEASNRTTVISLVQTDKTIVVHKVGDKIMVDVMIDPGRNLVSFFKADFLYDPAKLSISKTNGFKAEDAFPSVISGPDYSTGKVSVTLSTGANPKGALTQTTKAGTLTFTAVAPTEVDIPTIVSFGPETQALSIASQDNASENVIRLTNPVTLTIE